MRYISPRVQVIGLRGFGMCNVGHVSAFSLAIREASRHWLSVQMADISLAQAKTSQSTFGTLAPDDVLKK
jgi:hypothetical protein